MKAELLEEPELQFGRGRHIDPRFGLLELGPADGAAEGAPKTVKVGIVGTDETIEKVVGWLSASAKPISGRIDTKQPNLYPAFPGFNPNAGFEAKLGFDTRHQRSIPQRTIKQLRSIPDHAKRLEETAAAFVNELRVLADRALPDVVICAPALDVLQLAAAEADQRGTGRWPAQLHDLLKARAMSCPVPVQYILPATYDQGLARKQAALTRRPAGSQDEATRAWNIHTALYYKAGGYPWSLVRQSRDLQTCFIGISFYWESEDILATSLAQVFNERGEGVIVRGGPAKLSRGDKQPYLPRDDAERLLADALAEYRSEHHHLPARVVVHKTSSYKPSEREGFEAAAEASDIDSLELVALGDTTTRFFTPRTAPPYRGTHVELDQRHQLLYTSGKVPFYDVYPGFYVPQPLSIVLESSHTAPRRHALEVLALTKLNWNHSRLDGRDPITILAARGIGAILRHVPADGAVGNRYAFYM